ncbi:MAG: copper-binding protein [Alphaproteobacteria bacterium]|nr:copper-binding protein [Alphaproteobacteria bacterium]MBF0129516.1 copper-binding protein [Alphaproteobacteria bacterium]
MNKTLRSAVLAIPFLAFSAPAPASGDLQAPATGSVNAVDAAKGVVNLTHDPIPALGWPAMTMDFGVAGTVDLTKVRKGAKVSFTVSKGPDGIFRITDIKPEGK